MLRSKAEATEKDPPSYLGARDSRDHSRPNYSLTTTTPPSVSQAFQGCHR